MTMQRLKRDCLRNETCYRQTERVRVLNYVRSFIYIIYNLVKFGPQTANTNCMPRGAWRVGAATRVPDCNYLALQFAIRLVCNFIASKQQDYFLFLKLFGSDPWCRCSHWLCRQLTMSVVSDDADLTQCCVETVRLTRAQLLLRWPRNVAQFELSLSIKVHLFNALFLSNHIIYCQKTRLLVYIFRPTQHGSNFNHGGLIGHKSYRIR